MAILLFVILGLYADGIRRKNVVVNRMESSLAKLECEKILAMQNQDDLRMQIASQSDPQWIEMVLMEKLGVVPEGQVKVYFK